jgi:tellurite resistance protein TerC
MFEYLHYGLSVILVLVGIKMLLADFYKIPVFYALTSVAGILLLSIIASVVKHRVRDSHVAEQSLNKPKGRQRE